MKKFCKILCLSLFALILLLLFLMLFNKIVHQYNYNHKYSIAMPQIIGEFKTEGNLVNVYGIENIIDDNIATLNINETYCFLNKEYMKCGEQRVVITGLGNNVSIFPYYNEYKIKYADKNKIIFESEIQGLQKTIGEIDLNAKTLIYTVTNAGIEHNKTRRIEVITDNKKIECLEKVIIRKYLKI